MFFYGCGVNIRQDFLGSLGVEDLQDSGLILAVWILTVLPAPNIPNIQDLPIETHVLVLDPSVYSLYSLGQIVIHRQSLLIFRKRKNGHPNKNPFQKD